MVGTTFREWRKRAAYVMVPLFSFLGRIFIRLVGMTLRVRVEGEGPVRRLVEEGRPYLLAFFHGRQFLPVWRLRRTPIAILTSLSYMGEVQAGILRGFGYTILKGSSTRGGMKGMVRVIQEVRAGKIAAFAVDGPNGPFHEVKPGILFLGRRVGVPIVPMSFSARPALELTRAWDRYLFPLPFARAVLRYGDPLLLEGDSSEEATEEDARKLRRILEDLDREADGDVGR